MMAMKRILPILVAAVALSACTDSRDEVVALKAEVLDLQRATDRLKRETKTFTTKTTLAEHRSSQYLLEKEKLHNDHRTLRIQTDILRTQTAELRSALATYKENCKVGTLDLSASE